MATAPPAGIGTGRAQCAGTATGSDAHGNPQAAQRHWRAAASEATLARECMASNRIAQAPAGRRPAWHAPESEAPRQPGEKRARSRATRHESGSLLCTVCRRHRVLHPSRVRAGSRRRSTCQPADLGRMLVADRRHPPRPLAGHRGHSRLPAFHSGGDADGHDLRAMGLYRGRAARRSMAVFPFGTAPADRSEKRPARLPMRAMSPSFHQPVDSARTMTPATDAWQRPGLRPDSAGRRRTLPAGGRPCRTPAPRSAEATPCPHPGRLANSICPRLLSIVFPRNTGYIYSTVLINSTR